MSSELKALPGRPLSRFRAAGIGNLETALGLPARCTVMHGPSSARPCLLAGETA